MRHAEAVMNGMGRDFDRPLTPIGERDARHMGRWINETLLEPEAIFASTALRARQTAEIVMEELQQSHTIVYEDDLYEASIRTLLGFVHQIPDDKAVALIVAHNPAITYLADYLTQSAVDGMSPGALAGLEFELGSWTLVAQHTARLIEFQTPNQL